MKSWAFAAIFISVGALAACDGDGSGGAGGGDGGSGGSGGSDVTTTTTTNPMTSTTTGMGGAPPGCDTGDPADCGDTMTGCIGCALGGNCSDELGACQADADCIAFAMCIDPCMDQACIDDCQAMHMTGADLYNTILVCVICEECPISCDGPGSGC